MNTTKIFLKSCTYFILCYTLAYGQAGYGTSPCDCSALLPAYTFPIHPTPTTAPTYVNLRNLLSVAGSFSAFLKYLESTNLIEALQAQPNDYEGGITLFVPKNTTFSNLKKPSLSNLTPDKQMKLFLFNVLPHYYSLSDFKKVSGVNPLAGGSYALNFPDDSATVHIGSGWTITAFGSSLVDDKDHVAIYEVNKVLLPEMDIPPAAAAVPDVSLLADDVSGKGTSLDSGTVARSSTPSTSCRIIQWNGWKWAVMVVVYQTLKVVL